MNTKFFKSFDYFLILCVTVLVTLGIMFIYSSGINSEGILVSNEYVKQIVWAGIGLVLMVVMTLMDYRRLSRYALPAAAAAEKPKKIRKKKERKAALESHTSPQADANSGQSQ